MEIYRRKFVVDFNEPKQKKKNIDHLLFLFKTVPLSDMSGFSINLIDGDNKPTKFNNGETNISILNFKIERFLK